MAGARKVPRVRGGSGRRRPSAWKPGPHADGHVREDRDHGATRPAEHCRRQDDGVEEPGAAGLSAPHARRGCVDRGRVSFRHQHAPGAPCARRGVPRRGQQGQGEPGVAKVRGDWEAWNRRSLAEEPIVRLILDGTVVRVRLDKKATAISRWSCSGSGRTARKSGGRAEHGWRDPEAGGRFSTISSSVGCASPRF